MDAMTLTDFLGKILPPEGEGLRHWVAIKDKQVRGSGFTKTNQELAKQLLALSACGADAYYACSTFKTIAGGRKQSNVQAAKSLWLDIDVGEGKAYEDLNGASRALERFSVSTGLPKPLTVRSGYGLHAYWVLDKPIGANEWAPLARRLKELTQEHGFKADPAVTSDSARILRPIGTLNYKNREDPHEVLLLSDADAVPVSTLLQILKVPRAPLVYNPDLGAAILRGLKTAQYEPAASCLVRDNCKQIRSFEQSGGNVPEPVWYSCLGVLAYCEDGEEFAQKWSSGYAGYSQFETARKLGHAREAAGPTTCAKFKELNPDGCKGCPHNVTSPIRLGREAVVTPPFIGDDEEVKDPEKAPPLPDGYKYGANNQIMGLVKDPDAEGDEPKFTYKMICKYPFYIASVREQETKGIAGEQSVKIMSRTPHNPWKGFTVLRKDLMGANWTAHLGEYGVVCVPGMEKPFRSLLYNMLIWRTDTMKMEISYKSFGWKNDRDGFVAGRKLYTKNGVSDISGTQEFEKAADLISPEPRGDLNKWRAAANRLFAKGCEAQAFAMLCSFAAPLMDLIYTKDEGGTIVSLVSSKTGQGKTVAILAAETVWGKTNCLRLTERASLAAKFRAIGVRCNMPIVIDEWGDADTLVLREFVANFTGGTDKTRLTMKGEDIREQLDWKTVMIGTTNLPLTDVLKAANYNAQAARIFEVPVAIPEHLSGSQTSNLSKQFEDNAGHAGPVFLIHLLRTQNLDNLRTKIENIANAIGKRLNAKGDERFKTRLVAAVAVAATLLAEKMPNGESLLELDPKYHIEWAISAINEAMNTEEPKKTPLEHLMDFIKDNMTCFLVVSGPFHNKAHSAPIIPKTKIVGRYEKENERLYVPSTAMQKFAVSIKMPYMEFAKELSSMNVVVQRNRQTTLTAGIPDLPATRVACWEIDLAHHRVKGVAKEITKVAKENSLR